ncbi:MAG: hypothetical protein H0T10_07680 [Actinobacteria bacterium]|nr:hypothetical protein [Actinomycetota bacterium]
MSFVVIGGFARVIHGTGETTSDIDIVPSTRPENLRRLSNALEEIGAAVPAFDVEEPTMIPTPLGDLKVVLTPAGTRGWDDLRRAANREPLGRGVRPSVASPGDLARMLAAVDRDQDMPKLRRLRRLIELEHELSRGRGIER